MAKLTDKQRRFCEEYLVDLNGTQAYLRAGYQVSAAVAAVNALRLLERPLVRERIQARQRELQQRTEITQERVLRELAAVGFSDVTDYVEVVRPEGAPFAEVVIKPTEGLPAAKRAALAGIKQGKYGVEIRLHDKLRALDQISRILGFIRDGGPPAQSGDNGLLSALEESAKEVFAGEVFDLQPEADAGTDLVGAPPGEPQV